MMKLVKVTVILLVMITLTACTQAAVQLKQEQLPDYLTVYQAYQQTPLYRQCQQYESEIKEQNSEAIHWLPPYKTDDGMEIVSSTRTDDHFIYRVSCEVTAYFQCSAFCHFQEEHSQYLGEVQIQRKKENK